MKKRFRMTEREAVSCHSHPYFMFVIKSASKNGKMFQQDFTCKQFVNQEIGYEKAMLPPQLRFVTRLFCTKVPSTKVKLPVGPIQFFFSNNRPIVSEHQKRYVRCEQDPRHFENTRSYKSDPIKTVPQKPANVPWMQMCHVNPLIIVQGCVARASGPSCQSCNSKVIHNEQMSALCNFVCI